MCMKPIARGLKVTAAGWIVVLIFGALPILAESNKALSDSLIQYVRKARKIGLSQSLVLQEAVNDGWPASETTEAIVYVWSQPLEPDTPSHAPDEATPPKAEDGQTPASTSPASSAPTPEEAEARAKAEAAARSLPYDYHIGEGDVLQVSVWKEPETSAPSVVVRPDGKISMPLLKEVHVAGLTPTEAEKLITFRLSKVITDPEVTIVVSATHSQKIYAVGAVKREGPIPYTYRMSIMQAISEAGGLTDYAKRKKIYVLRTESGLERKLPFDYDTALRGDDRGLNILLLPGDTLVVP